MRRVVRGGGRRFITSVGLTANGSEASRVLLIAPLEWAREYGKTAAATVARLDLP